MSDFSYHYTFPLLFGWGQGAHFPQKGPETLQNTKQFYTYSVLHEALPENTIQMYILHAAIELLLMNASLWKSGNIDMKQVKANWITAINSYSADNCEQTWYVSVVVDHLHQTSGKSSCMCKYPALIYES